MNKDREMINANKAILVYFTGTFAGQNANATTGDVYMPPTSKSSVAYANIYIPFQVKEIHVRGIDIDWNADYYSIYFTSSLVDNGPLGSGYAGIYSDTSTSTKKMKYIFDQPRDVNGTYRFEYFRIEQNSGAFLNTKTPSYPSSDGGGVLFMLEFVGYK